MGRAGWLGLCPGGGPAGPGGPGGSPPTRSWSPASFPRGGSAACPPSNAPHPSWGLARTSLCCLSGLEASLRLTSCSASDPESVSRSKSQSWGLKTAKMRQVFPAPSGTWWLQAVGGPWPQPSRERVTLPVCLCLNSLLSWPRAPGAGGRAHPKSGGTSSPGP